MNQNMCEFDEYLLVIVTGFLCPKEHHTSSRDIIGGVEPLLVDIYINIFSR